MKVFGAGEFFGIPLFDALGNIIANPTPVRVGTMQEMGLDLSGDIKELFGQNQFAVEVARGKTKLDGKVKGATINAATLDSLFLGQGRTAGTQDDVVADTVGWVVPAGGPYTVAPTVPNSGTIAEDLGVTDANETPLTKVASAPSAGQYSYAAGVWTFAAGDAGATVFVSYRYSFTNPKAQKIVITNPAMGAAASFGVRMVCKYAGKRCLVVLNKVVASKLSFLSTKQDDFNIPEFDFAAQAFGGTVGFISLSD